MNIIYINLKSKGPRTEPCGTPNLMISFDDIFSSIWVVCIRPAKYDLNQLLITPRMP